MTLLYMLDTDTVSFALRGFGGVPTRLLEHRPSEICMSAITLAELRYGADHRRSRKLHGLIDAFAAAVTVVPVDEGVAARFGAVASALVRQGTPIGSFDALIAAHALVLDVTLVTNNAKHFSRVHGLRMDNWV
ncbi:type II toxin-antitoxin system VapC family toxin [Sorangium sp. So ce124]|uniref:type II toxin-antitoxin system VapC family toxin n=1 Tax=Sorangium sp. So ce124 TaxID=3133280 RepID=UPI003F60F5E6